MIKEIKTKIIKNIKKYPILFYFLTSSIINATMLRVFTVQNYFDIKPILMDMGIVLLLGVLSFCVKKNNRKKYYIIVSILLTAICIVNSMYYTYYKSYASFSMLATSVFVVDVGDAVVENVIQIKDIIFVWQVLGLLYLLKYEQDKKYKDYSLLKKPKLKKMVTVAISCCLVVLVFSTASDYARLTKEWNKKGVVINFGIYLYQINDLCQSLQPKLNNILGHDKALKSVRDYYQENKKEKTINEYSSIFEGKNLIVIHAESLQTMAINLELNGKIVTPNLNKIAQEGMFFSNFYSQVGVGTSSDAEFSFSTSLLPSSNGTVFVNYYDRKFITIQQLLKEKGYYVASMHANVGEFWNREVMHKNMGYDMLYDKDYYNIDETIGLGLSDKSFFNQSVDLIEEIKHENNKPFYINLITLTNHTPFSDLELMDEFDTSKYVDFNNQTIKREYINNTVLGNYFRSVHYADQAIGEFIQKLDDKGLLENTVVVIYGDHDARIEEEYYNLYYNYDGIEDRILTEKEEGYTLFNEYTYEINRKVPFIIWTKDTNFNKEITTPMSMIDAMPTLGNMFGFSSKYQLGQDIFNVQDNTVVFVDGSFLTEKIYYNSQKEESYPINNNAISDEYVKIRSEKADKLIEISNNIIEYNLIKEMELLY